MPKKIISGYKGAEPILVGAYIDEVVPGGRFGPYVHDTYVVECNTGGYGSFSINGKVYPVKPGDCYILFPGRVNVHTADNENPRRGVYCRMQGTRVGEILCAAGITDASPYAPPELFSEITALINKMIGMKNDTDGGVDLRRTACIYELLGTLMRGRAHVDIDLILERALGIFESEYHESLSIQTVAERVGFERSYFSVMFKEKTGVSPHAYLTSLRISRAETLLLDDRYSVSEIAEAVGLSAVNFARIFKRETGISPLGYKKIHKKSK